jgi:hypothetical protein
MFTKFDSIVALVKDPSFILEEDNTITWLSTDKTQPTETEIQAKIIELQADYDSKQYQRDRADAYPSWQDQLDNIFHNGIDVWKSDIQAIKDQFPKP